MKKQALKAVTMLVSIIALAFMTAVASSAQSHKLKADIPFDFVVGDKTLAAGEYTVGQITRDQSGIVIDSRDGKQSVIRLSNNLQANAPKQRTMLTFHRYGNSYFLAQVWTAGSAQGRELVRSKAERAAERELAKNASQGEVAQGMEVVTIFAELR
jgi:hypothetical protein